MIKIEGKIPSKSNCYKVITIAGHGSLGKTPELKRYEKSFAWQYWPQRIETIQGDFELVAHVYFENNRPDLDNAFKIVLDCLQANNAISNDRYCVHLDAYKHFDKNNPRIELQLNPL